MKGRGEQGIFFRSLFLLVLLLLSNSVAAHEETNQASGTSYTSLVDDLQSLNLNILGLAYVLILILIGLTLKFPSFLKYKTVLFTIIAILTISATAFLVGSTLYINTVSVSKGPVHWHADHEVWACGQKLDLINPEGLSNRIGTSTLHEHGDDRIHVEGVVHRIQDVTLGNYLNKLSGDLHPDHFSYPSTIGLVSYSNGHPCFDNQPGILKVFVNGKKIRNPHMYVLSPEANVPPGDCIIIDFSPGDAETTDKICSSWSSKGWTYENQQTLRKGQSIEMPSEIDDHQHGSSIEHDEHEEEGMYSDITSVGPGDPPHLHALDYSKLVRVKDVARLPLVSPSLNSQSTTVKIGLVTKEVVSEVAPGITYAYWTFNGTVPGPFIRIKKGDAVELSLTNDLTSIHNHSIDLHAVTGPGGGAAVTQVKPGETKTLIFKALNPGLYVYHCATPNVPMHMAQGMYGLILVEPEEGLSPVDREYYVMQGELYTQGAVAAKGFQEFDAVKMINEDPEYFLFNGRVKALVDHPLTADVGEKIRIYVGNGGVSAISSFHIIGEIFDTVYPEASTSTIHHVQTTLIPAGGASIVELTTDLPGQYVLVDHALARLDRGAWGILSVKGSHDTSIYNPIPAGGDAHGS